ncbi:MAG: GIY-YIG nuclease family protein [Lachnospiraceae bacterium]|nr:GIY-YIG nuclease family protein [Lachnospiraceae bacterium]
MAKGIIYVMTTAVPGLIKIGKTGSGNFEQRMYNLEHDGYRNVTALKREFAIEVDGYDEKENLLHTIFEKSRLADTELFAVDVNTVKQLLSSFDGTMIYPLLETKDEVFVEATENSKGKLIPNGKYEFKRYKKSDNKTVKATAIVQNGSWTLLQGSVLGVTEDVGMSMKGKKTRNNMPLDVNGKLLEDFELGECSPSFAGAVVMNQSNDGWLDWKNIDGERIDIYRKMESEE